MITNTNYVVTTEQTGMVMEFRNKELIADLVMPIKKLRGKQASFKYAERNLADGFTVPSTLIGRASVPNQATFSITEKPGMCVDFGLGSFVPQQDIDESEGQVGDLVSDSLAAIMNLVLLDREVRVAKIVQSPANYSNVVNVEASDKFDSEDSNPLEYILEALDKCVVRPNRMVIGQRAWTKLRTNSAIVMGVNKNSGGFGVATRQAVAELLEIQEVIVGASFVNTARKGKEAVIETCWGNNVAFHYYEPVADASNGIAWGMTFQSGERVASSSWNDEKGLKGGYDVKAGASWAEKVTAKGAGLLLTGVIA